MNPLFRWYNLVFELPAALAAVLLVVSCIRPRHGHTGHAAGPHAAPGARSRMHLQASQTSSHQSSSQHPRTGRLAASASHSNYSWRHAPQTAVAGFFALFWGVGGFLFNTIFIGGAVVTMALVMQSAAVALVLGLAAARGGAELLVRVMPRDETYDVSRDGLYGLTGEVAYEVTDHGGRVLVYDDHGTLHDEICRTACQGATISKGAQARIVDKDQEGHLLVEEVFS